MSEWKHLTPVPGSVQRNPVGGTRRRWLVIIALGALIGAGVEVYLNSGSDFARQAPAASAWSLDPGQSVPAPVDLPIGNIPQETEVWCWAAVAQQIVAATRGLHNTPPQCALVAIANGAPPEACCRGYNPQCVRPGSLEQIQDLIRHFGGRSSSYAPPTDPMTLHRTLAQGRAVIIALRMRQDMGHVVVVRGMSFQPTPGGFEPVLHVNDPMAVYTQPIPFRSLVDIWESAIIVN